MNNKIKLGTVKYLIAASSLLPIANTTSAEEKEDKVLPSVGEYTLFVSAGLEHSLPSYIINNQIKYSDLEGFNPGLYAEIGACNWSGQHGKTNYEHHIGFSWRFDYHNFHSRVYNLNAAANASGLAGETSTNIDPSEHGCAHIQDVINTFNVHSGFGWAGVIVDANVGVGVHFDTNGNIGPVCVLGCGLGYRINNNFRVDARWRVNIFPFENFNSKTNPGTTHALRDNLEIGVIYKLNALYKGQKKHSNGKHR